MKRLSVARAISIVAHPALLLPAAVVGVAFGRELPAESAAAVTAAAVGTALAVMGFSYIRVRSGRWDHADASRRRERIELNRFLALALLLVALLSWATSQPKAVTAGAVLCAGVVVVALSLRSWLKVSLHVAFAALAALLWWPLQPAVLLLLLIALAVAWSRVALGRHSRAEVLVGLVLGGVAGSVFQYVGHVYQ